MTMNYDLVADIWQGLKHYIHTTEMNDAADALITVLIDAHGLDPQEIYDAFADSPVVRRAAKHYLTVDHGDSEDDSIEELDFED